MITVSICTPVINSVVHGEHLGYPYVVGAESWWPELGLGPGALLTVAYCIVCSAQISKNRAQWKKDFILLVQ